MRVTKYTEYPKGSAEEKSVRVRKYSSGKGWYIGPSVELGPRMTTVSQLLDALRAETTTNALQTC